MKEKTTRREFNGCLGAAMLALLAGGAITGLATSKYLERERFRASFAEVEKEILEQFKRYVARTPEQIQADVSFEDWEKIYLALKNDSEKIYSSDPHDKPIKKGPYLSLTLQTNDFPRIDFWYYLEKDVYSVEFSRGLEGYEFILSKNTENNRRVNTIRYVINPENKRIARSVHRLQGKAKSLKTFLDFSDSEQIFSLIRDVERNYLLKE